MANPIFQSCLGCQSLRTGSIIAGAAAIIMSVIFIILMFTVKDFQLKTILFDWLPKTIVQAIVAFNMCMTILISAIMIVGAVKVGFHLLFSSKFSCSNKIKLKRCRSNGLIAFKFYSEIII